MTQWTAGVRGTGAGVVLLHPALLCVVPDRTWTSIHSRPTEPAELQEPTAAQGISGNLKIPASAVPYSTGQLAPSDPSPSPHRPPTLYFHCALGALLTPLNGFLRPHRCLASFNSFFLRPLINVSSLAHIAPNGKHQRGKKRGKVHRRIC